MIKFRHCQKATKIGSLYGKPVKSACKDPIRSRLTLFQIFQRSTVFKKLFCILLLQSLINVGIAQTRITEDQIKAVYMFNFANFIEWPETAFKTAKSPILYCSIGNTAVSKNLDAAVSGEKISNRSLKHISLEPDSDPSACHILYLPDSYLDKNQSLLQKQMPSTLTVGDSYDFIKAGGMVGLVREKTKISLVINIKRTGETNFKLSSKILRLAKIWDE